MLPLGTAVAAGMGGAFVGGAAAALAFGDWKMATELGQSAGVLLAAVLAVPRIVRVVVNSGVAKMTVGELKQLGPYSKEIRDKVDSWARRCLSEAAVHWHGEEGEQDGALGTQVATIGFRPSRRARATRAEAQIWRRDGMLEMGGVGETGRGPGEPLAIDEVYEALRRYHEK